MFYTSTGLAEKYNYLEEKFKTGYAFLRRTDLAELPAGPVDLGDGITANVQHYTTFSAADAKFETHEKYFDIQYVISGEEMFGIVSREGLEVDTPYDAEKDITFYKEPPACGSVLLREGDLVVVAPEDAHKPRCTVKEACPVKKIVIKVPV